MGQEWKRKLIYWSLMAGSFAWMLIFAWSVWTLCMPSHPAPGFPWFLYVPALLVAPGAAGAIGRRLGICSRLQRFSEALPKQGSGSSAAARRNADVPALRWPLAVCGTFMAALGIWFMHGSSVYLYDIRESVYLAVIFCWLPSAWCWRLFGRARAAVCADERGITRQHLLGSQQVRWRDVTQVDVRTDHDALGRPFRTVCDLYGRSGDLLMTVTLDMVPEAARNRLLEVIRARQGLPPGRRTELEAAMAPQGTGLEPEATLAPAGRGTEPEAASALDSPGAEPEATAESASRGREPEVGERTR